MKIVKKIKNLLIITPLLIRREEAGACPRQMIKGTKRGKVMWEGLYLIKIARY
jgi:hypothetical protein